MAPTKSQQTRERILDAAALTLSRRGYAGTRLADVAREAGIQTPGIYYYFGSREQLIGEVVVEGTSRLRAHVAAALAAAPAGAGPLERLDIVIDAHLRHLVAERSFAHAVIRNHGQLPDAIRRRQRQEERRYDAIWRQLFGEAQATGELAADLDADLASSLVAGSLNWATEWWTAKRWPLATLIATAQALARTGLTR